MTSYNLDNLIFNCTPKQRDNRGNLLSPFHRSGLDGWVSLRNNGTDEWGVVLCNITLVCALKRERSVQSGSRHTPQPHPSPAERVSCIIGLESNDQ